MTQKAATLQSAVELFGAHFKRNKKQPPVEKMEQWLHTNYALLDKAEYRKVYKRCMVYAYERWGINAT